MYINTNLDERKYDFRDRCSRLVELNETITLPHKGKLIPIDFEEKVGNDITSFEGNIKLDGKSFEFLKKLIFQNVFTKPLIGIAFKKSGKRSAEIC